MQAEPPCGSNAAGAAIACRNRIMNCMAPLVGCAHIWYALSGGVASLNRRLIADNPPGFLRRVAAPIRG
jgi:hypothetical protein